MASSYYSPTDGFLPSSICSTCGGGAPEAITESCPVGDYAGAGGVSVLKSDGQASLTLPMYGTSSIGGMSSQPQLNYHAGTDVDGLFGKYVNYPENTHLEELPDGDVILILGDNTAQLYSLTGSGTYEPADQNTTQAELTRSGVGADDKFTLVSAKAVTTEFAGFDPAVETPGVLLSITDRYDNRIEYNWVVTCGNVQLATVVDSYDLLTSWEYYGSEQGFKVRKITNSVGCRFFQYDKLGHLSAVILPAVTKASPGNDFPSGTAYAFIWDVDNPRSDRRDDLLAVYAPNQATPFINAETMSVDLTALCAASCGPCPSGELDATCIGPRVQLIWGQDASDTDNYGKVVRLVAGSPKNGVGGTIELMYNSFDLPENIVDPTDPIVQRVVETDRNGNQIVTDHNAQGMTVRHEVIRSRSKIDIPPFPPTMLLSTPSFDGYVTWTKFNIHNQPLLRIFPEGNSIEYEYEDGQVSGISGTYFKRVGLLLRQTRKVDNPFKNDPINPIPAYRDGPSNGQTELTQRFFYGPLFNNPVAVIEERGNPIDDIGTYFPPQNGGTSPTNSDRSRYATITFYDYQKNTIDTVKNNSDLQTLLGLTAVEIQALIDHVDNQMKATDGTGGLPNGFQLNLGDINGDGTGDGAASGLPAANILGNTVKVFHPEVRLIGSSTITQQVREEIFTTNNRGQITTHTNAEGNLTVYVRYPERDPEGNGQFIATQLGGKQYGRTRAVHVDADPNDVMSLVGEDGDLVDFIPGIINRSNTPDEYQNLITRYEGTSIGAGAGCASCAYDPIGNPLTTTDPRGFTTHFDRNELGEVFRVTGPDPYRYQTETYFDANRNVVRVDTQDQWVQYESNDPTAAGFAHFELTGSGSTGQVPSRQGFGGAIRPGWFTNFSQFDLLDNLIEQNADATGSAPDRLITGFQYDPNENLITTTKPAGNTVDYDYEERNLRIAERVGNSPDSPAISVTAYGGNGNMIQAIGPAQRGGTGNQQTVIIEDAFRSGTTLTHTGDFALENTLDGFNRVIESKDAAGNVTSNKYDPGGRVVETCSEGPIGGATPTNRDGAGNVELAKSLSRFDEAGRQYESQQEVFFATGTTLPSGRTVTHTGGGLEANSTADGHTGTVTLTSGGSSYTLSRTVFDRASRAVEVLADNTAVTTSEYDGADRRIRSIDPFNNERISEYDANSNIIYTKSIERATITEPSIEPEVFETASRYDSLNRLVAQATANPTGEA